MRVRPGVSSSGSLLAFSAHARRWHPEPGGQLQTQTVNDAKVERAREWRTRDFLQIQPWPRKTSPGFLSCQGYLVIAPSKLYLVLFTHPLVGVTHQRWPQRQLQNSLQLCSHPSQLYPMGKSGRARTWASSQGPLLRPEEGLWELTISIDPSHPGLSSAH